MVSIIKQPKHGILFVLQTATILLQVNFSLTEFCVSSFMRGYNSAKIIISYKHEFCHTSWIISELAGSHWITSRKCKAFSCSKHQLELKNFFPGWSVANLLPPCTHMFPFLEKVSQSKIIHNILSKWEMSKISQAIKIRCKVFALREPLFTLWSTYLYSAQQVSHL